MQGLFVKKHRNAQTRVFFYPTLNGICKDGRFPRCLKILAGEGAPLTTGAQRLLEAKAKAAGLTLEQVTAEYGTVTLANLNEVLAKLGARAQDAQP